MPGLLAEFAEGHVGVPGALRHRIVGKGPFPVPDAPSGGPEPPSLPADLLDVALQPVVDIHTGRCYGYEALLRNTEAAGFASIADFFDHCHATGQLVQAELMVRDKALAKFVRIPHHERVKLFVNMDTRALDASDAIVEGTLAALARHRVAAASVVLELSERHFVAQSAVEALLGYKQAGFRVAMDDFGIGFAGMESLYFSDPSYVKVDRFFVAGVATDSRKKILLSLIVQAAHLLGIAVVAEGVETEAELAVCREAGCDLVQGWLIQRATCDVTRLAAGYEAVASLGRRDRRGASSDQHLIADQIGRIEPIPLDASMEQVFQRFRATRTATFFPVVDRAGEPVGIVRETDIKAYAYSPYGKELMCNRAYRRKLDRFISRCPIADITTPAGDLLQTYSAIDKSEGIIVVDRMKYVGFLSASALLCIINEKNLAAARDQNPLTRLPGNTVIHDYVGSCLATPETGVVLAYFDFDNFKPFNDKYGFRLGDRAILLFAELLSKTLPRERCFAGHVGGDDFFAGFQGMAFEEVARLCHHLVGAFARDVESFYDDDSRRAGGIVGQDRLGNTVKFPLMTVSAALVDLPAGHKPRSIDEISHLIADLKKSAKASSDRICSAAVYSVLSSFGPRVTPGPVFSGR